MAAARQRCCRHLHLLALSWELGPHQGYVQLHAGVDYSITDLHAVQLTMRDLRTPICGRNMRSAKCLDMHAA